MSPVMQEMLSIVENGIQPKASKPSKVLVLGAGMAGLTAAYELQRAGHDPYILEARQRVGGRVYTMREPFAPGLHAEAGAMRVPRAHLLTFAYINKFGLTVSPFAMSNPKGFCYVYDQRYRIAEANANPDQLGFDVAAHEMGKAITQLWQETLAPIARRLQTEGEAAWPEIIKQYDNYCTRDFLEANKWSEGAIEMFGLLAGQEARMYTACTELLREELGRSFNDMVQIDGGMDNLPKAFLPALKDRIRFGAKVVAIEQEPESVTVYYVNYAGRQKITGDYAIVTIPFPVLRHIDVLPSFSHAKQRAIRQLHYDASAKIFLQSRRRFWEEDDGIFGGGTVTDLPIRSMYYPEHGRETGRGVLLASYTWAEDAQRWGSLTEAERITEALENVVRIHPQIAEEFEVGASKMWHEDEFAGGAFALFAPEQETLLQQSIIAPEGRIHFAGEHTSLTHRWIQGAIESGLRTALEIHEASAYTTE